MYPCPTRGISRKLVPFLFAAVLAAGFPVAAQETADTLIAKPAKPAEGSSSSGSLKSKASRASTPTAA